ncbi:MAG TPA: hypothetical protein VGV15_00110, partial [Terriglobales bacterium]|nr:hypothetical protein [Terriglobales bacterium]
SREKKWWPRLVLAMAAWEECTRHLPLVLDLRVSACELNKDASLCCIESRASVDLAIDAYLETRE